MTSVAAHSATDEFARRYRVAFVNTHPIQYFAPLYSYMTEHSGLDVTALYLSDFSIRDGLDKGFGRNVTWDVDLLRGYNSAFMGQAASRRRIGGFFSMIAPELWPAIRAGKFDAVVIHGHFLAAHHMALAASKSAGSLVFARGETHLRLKRPHWKEQLRTPILRTLYRQMDAFLAIGTENARYYRSMGVPAERIFHVPYTVDNDRFIKAAKNTDRDAVRTRLGLSGTAPAILFASKFDQRKRPDDLLHAASLLQQKGADVQIVMVGSGLLESELRRLAEKLELRSIHFPGFINQVELPSVYAACDIFTLPSEGEPWGLVVNEAMCAGLPIVLSEEIGCAADLVETGVNGAKFPAGDVEAFVAALEPIVRDAELRARLGAASLARIRNWSYAESGLGIRKAIEWAQRHRASR